MMNTSEPIEPPVRAIDRFLAWASIALVGAAIISFIAIIIGTATGLQHDDFQGGIWLVASPLLYWGLPLGVVLFFILLISNMVRRSRANRDQGGTRTR